MKYAIFILLLLMFGCLAQEPGKVTELDLPNKTTDSGAAADSSASDTASDSGAEAGDAGETSEPDTGSADAGGTDGGLVNPSAPSPDWGTECEDSYDCGSFNDRKDCVMGKCVDTQCIFRDDCKEKDHCFDGKCYLESELYAQFPECGVNVGCNITCAGCESGKRRCIVTGWGSGNESKDYYICTECNRDYDCLEGYRCVQHYCVKGPN